MNAWGKDQQVGEDVVMLADGNGAFAKAVGLTMDGSGFGMGSRSQRYSMVVEDGVVKQLNVEAPGEFKVSSAEAILAAGAPRGLELAGLGARDSLRLEAGYPLYGHEITQEISPLTAGLGWTVKLDKGADFIGRAALVAEKQNGAPKKVVFFKTGDRRIVRADHPVLAADGTTVGRVLSGTLSPLLNEAIGSALVTMAAAAQPLQVDIRGTKLNLQLVRPPFVELKKM
jgi:aminomethyltransferase